MYICKSIKKIVKKNSLNIFQLWEWFFFVKRFTLDLNLLVDNVACNHQMPCVNNILVHVLKWRIRRGDCLTIIRISFLHSKKSTDLFFIKFYIKLGIDLMWFNLTLKQYVFFFWCSCSILCKRMWWRRMGGIWKFSSVKFPRQT